MLGHAKIETTQRYYIKWFKQQNLERDQQMMMKVSELHRLLAAPPPTGLPKPVGDLFEIEGEALEIE